MSDPHVIVLAFHYPPSKEVGGIRAQKVALMFRSAGLRVTVITDSGTQPLPDGNPTSSGIEVIRIRQARGPRALYAATRRYLRGKSSADSPSPSAVPHATAPRQISTWRRLLNSFAALPDEHQGFILAAWRAVRAARTKETRLVYTTAPPFSSHLAGLLIRKTTSLRWIAEFRDPWTDNAWRPAHRRSGLADRVSGWLERRCLRAADLVVAVTERAADRLRAKLPPTRRNRVVTVLNGIDTLHVQKVEPGRTGPFRIVHVGSFYHQRDPGPFLTGIAEVVQRHGLKPDALKILLVGNCRWFRGNSVEHQVKTLGLQTYVEFRDWVPHAESCELMAAGNLLLLLAQHQPLQVPNKLYEYLGTGVPILAFAEPESETAEMLRRAGGHWTVSGTAAGETEATLEAAMGLVGGRARPAQDTALLEQWTTARQMGLLRHHIEALIGIRTGQDGKPGPIRESPAVPR